MKLFWDFSSVPRFISPGAMGVTLKGRLIPIPRMVLLGDRLRYFGPVVGAYTFFHELVHVSFATSQKPLKKAKEEKLAQQVGL
ncbi:MAG: hypothetical protein ACYSYU_07885, partial [Planctomycetota bacterium]